MIDIKQFISAVKQIAEEKGISEGSIYEAIEAALAAAYKRDYGKRSQIVRAKLDPESGKFRVFQVHYAIEGVDDDENIIGPIPGMTNEEKEEMSKKIAAQEEGQMIDDSRLKYNPEKHISLKDAKKKKKGIKVGDELVEEMEVKTEFGRIAAQNAKQVVLQRLREFERNAVLEEFREKEGKLVSGVVQRCEGALVFIDVGKTNGILTPAEQIQSDDYRPGQRLRFVVLRVEETSRGPVVVLSRSNQKLVYELFRVEVPEIDSETVEIKAIARDAGLRAKVAVASHEEGVDPIGSLVGQKGVRVQTVINDLGGEKIDIVLWDPDITKFIAGALSPAKIMDVKIVDSEKKVALAEVSDDQFSLAIGKRGQNVRLAAKLTGWRIDVRSSKEDLSSEEKTSKSENVKEDEEEKPKNEEKEESKEKPKNKEEDIEEKPKNEEKTEKK